jgi:myo-inositol-1-phosphate synthase
VKFGKDIPKATGKLGIMIPGMGAVSTTFIAGVELVRKGRAKPIGSLTQMGTIRLGKRPEKRIPFIKDFISLANLQDLEFVGWDIFKDNCYDSALKAGVLKKEDVEPVKDFLQGITPLPAVFDTAYVRKLNGPNIKQGKTKADLAKMLMEDIQKFREESGVTRCVMVWCASTEVYMKRQQVHDNLELFERGLKNNDAAISPSMIYAYAALKSGIPFANGAPNLSVQIPALMQLAEDIGLPIAGSDFKTGQTLLKTVVAPMLKARLLGLKGWFSTNILGNRDGEVLDDPLAFQTKEASKLSVLEQILQPELYPELYQDFYHKVRINYYPPRGDNKEGWDNLDIFGWLNYPMQIKIDFLCRDSILAAPIVLDLALFMDLAKRAEMKGIQEWLSFYFKSPMCAPGLYPENDLFIQLSKLKNTLRYMMGEELITHLGIEYYDY